MMRLRVIGFPFISQSLRKLGYETKTIKPVLLTPHSVLILTNLDSRVINVTLISLRMNTETFLKSFKCFRNEVEHKFP